MVTALFGVLLILQLKAAAALEPCIDYETIWMGYGYRSSHFNSYSTQISLCDSDLDEAAWYRFDFDAGTQLIETAVSPWYCGTQSPIWVNGSHPTSEGRVIRKVCATVHNNDCWWSGNISIQLCNQAPDSFYVYQLAIPEGCPLAYCVDAATQKQCLPPLIWIQDEFRCGENATKPPTVAPSSTTPYTRITSTTSTTPAIPSDWSPWESPSSCSKPCDYGTETRKRKCENLPCDGASSENQLCNTYNCKELEEEKTKGIIIEFSSTQNTMLTVVENEKRVNELMRQSINSLCSANASLCCGVNIDRVPPNGIVYVTYSDIYTPQGYPKENSDVIVDEKVIAVVNTDIYQSVCQGGSGRISKRQSEPSGKKYITFEVMAMAVTDCSDQINKETGLNVNSYKDPAKIEETEESEDCPTTTCVIPILIGCVIGIAGISCLAVAISKCSKKANQVQSPPPYSYRKDTELPETNDQAYVTVGLPIYVVADSSQAGLPPVYPEK